jgi:formate hydrogenlyase subunit 6/NADH:ubiquinone oxidoreductase subunit I
MDLARRRKARVDIRACVACGVCAGVCPRGAIAVFRGLYAKVTDARCIGCAICEKACPASVITMVQTGEDAV